jgi:hypothetical protein
VGHATYFSFHLLFFEVDDSRALEIIIYRLPFPSSTEQSV